MELRDMLPDDLVTGVALVFSAPLFQLTTMGSSMKIA